MWWEPYSDEIACEYWALRSEQDPITGCVEWAGEFREDRLAIFTIGGTTGPAGEVALVDCGRWPPSTAHGLHVACGNPRCVNPDHLRWVLNPPRLAIVGDADEQQVLGSRKS